MNDGELSVNIKWRMECRDLALSL